MEDDFTSVRLRKSTVAGLNNLFCILGIDGDSFDEHVYNLAQRAFACNAVVPELERLRAKAPVGQARPRKQIQIKMDTVDYLLNIHDRMFPFLKWVSWDWFLWQMCSEVEEKVLARRGGPGSTNI